MTFRLHSKKPNFVNSKTKSEKHTYYKSLIFIILTHETSHLRANSRKKNNNLITFDECNMPCIMRTNWDLIMVLSVITYKLNHLNHNN